MPFLLPLAKCACRSEGHQWDSWGFTPELSQPKPARAGGWVEQDMGHGVLAASTTMQLHAWSCLLLIILWAKQCQGPAKPHSPGAVPEHPGVLLSFSMSSSTDVESSLGSLEGAVSTPFLLSADLLLPALHPNYCSTAWKSGLCFSSPVVYFSCLKSYSASLVNPKKTTHVFLLRTG